MIERDTRETKRSGAAHKSVGRSVDRTLWWQIRLGCDDFDACLLDRCGGIILSWHGGGRLVFFYGVLV